MILILISIFLGALGQLFLRLASANVGNKDLINFYLYLLQNYYLWLGFGCYGLSFLIWLKVLSKFDLSFARPLVGLGYIVAALLAWWILGETITCMRWLGILLIVSGVVIVGMTGSKV